MRKDIFIDNNIAKNFTNPLDPEYKRLIRWLIAYNSENSSKNAYLMVSNKLIAEYQRTAGTSASGTNITIIIAKMTRERAGLSKLRMSRSGSSGAYISQKELKEISPATKKIGIIFRLCFFPKENML